jgi:predicted TIM-barrel fold metal-dependent hydrolase
VLAEHGIDTQVLTFTSPGTHVEAPETAVALATEINNDFAEIVRSRSRFTALATLPLNDPLAAGIELDRAMTQLGFKGAMLFSNVNGTALSDECYWPMYEGERSGRCALHPSHSPCGR